jgi:hypothetical protein
MTPPEPKRQIPPERQALYYGGMALAGVGLLLFLSVFVTGMANFGNFDHFEERARSEGLRGIGGMVLMMAGVALMNVGARGLAGSGVVLDPRKAREDVEPWARMAGGVARDALDETGLLREGTSPPPPPVVKVRCLKCRALNDEGSKFCNQCGSPV